MYSANILCGNRAIKNEFKRDKVFTGSEHEFIRENMHKRESLGKKREDANDLRLTQKVDQLFEGNTGEKVLIEANTNHTST